MVDVEVEVGLAHLHQHLVTGGRRPWACTGPFPVQGLSARGINFQEGQWAPWNKTTKFGVAKNRRRLEATDGFPRHGALAKAVV